MNRKVAYIAGPITGVKDYRARFKRAADKLGDQGWIVLNPAELPEGMVYEAYIPICLAMLAAADTLFVLPGSEKSCGALAEIAFARAMGKKTVCL